MLGLFDVETRKFNTKYVGPKNKNKQGAAKKISARRLILASTLHLQRLLRLTLTGFLSGSKAVMRTVQASKADFDVYRARI